MNLTEMFNGISKWYEVRISCFIKISVFFFGKGPVPKILNSENCQHFLLFYYLTVKIHDEL